MTPPFRLFLSCTVVLIVASGSCAEEKMRESPYYPLQIGTSWIYKIGDKRFTVSVAAHEKIGDVLCARIDMSTTPGKVQTFEHVAIAEDGIYRYAIGGTRLNVPICILKLPPKKGDSWTINAKGIGEVIKGNVQSGEVDAVKVTAGVYNKVVTSTCTDLEVNDLKCTFTYYFAADVGIVKQQVQVGADKSTFELEKFVPGKK